MSADTFRKLAALNLTNDQIAGVLEIMEADSEVRKAKGRDRWHKWKAKKDGTNVSKHLPTTANVSSQLARAEDSSSNLDISGEVKKERKQDFVSPKAQPKNGTCIPDDFEPNLRWANQEGLGIEQARHEAAQFLDYWRAKAGAGARKRDWPRTWQVWVRTAMSRRPTARAGPPPKPTPTDALKEFAKLKGWTDGPNGSNGHNHDAEQFSADGGGRPGEIVSIRGGIAGRYR